MALVCATSSALPASVGGVGVVLRKRWNRRNANALPKRGSAQPVDHAIAAGRDLDRRRWTLLRHGSGQSRCRRIEGVGDHSGARSQSAPTCKDRQTCRSLRCACDQTRDLQRYETAQGRTKQLNAAVSTKRGQRPDQEPVKACRSRPGSTEPYSSVGRRSARSGPTRCSHPAPRTRPPPGIEGQDHSAHGPPLFAARETALVTSVISASPMRSRTTSARSRTSRTPQARFAWIKTSATGPGPTRRHSSYVPTMVTDLAHVRIWHPSLSSGVGVWCSRVVVGGSGK